MSGITSGSINMTSSSTDVHVNVEASTSTSTNNVPKEIVPTHTCNTNEDVPNNTVSDKIITVPEQHTIPIEDQNVKIDEVQSHTVNHETLSKLNSSNDNSDDTSKNEFSKTSKDVDMVKVEEFDSSKCFKRGASESGVIDGKGEEGDMSGASSDSTKKVKIEEANNISPVPDTASSNGKGHGISKENNPNIKANEGGPEPQTGTDAKGSVTCGNVLSSSNASNDDAKLTPPKPQKETNVCKISQLWKEEDLKALAVINLQQLANDITLNVNDTHRTRSDIKLLLQRFKSAAKVGVKPETFAKRLIAVLGYDIANPVVKEEILIAYKLFQADLRRAEREAKKLSNDNDEPVLLPLHGSDKPQESNDQEKEEIKNVIVKELDKSGPSLERIDNDGESKLTEPSTDKGSNSCKEPLARQNDTCNSISREESGDKSQAQGSACVQSNSSQDTQSTSLMKNVRMEGSQGDHANKTQHVVTVTSNEIQKQGNTCAQSNTSLECQSSHCGETNAMKISQNAPVAEPKQVEI